MRLFDPKLLAAFQKAVAEHMQRFEEAMSRVRVRVEEGDPPTKIPRTNDAELDPLMEFEYKCPPGGDEFVVLYTTTLRGIRKTFEDCNEVRFLERDVSIHLEFREELWRVLQARATLPRLFIRGCYVGDANKVLELHEQGGLLPLLRGVPLEPATGGEVCEGCARVRFVVCWEYSGSRSMREEHLGPKQCHRCNENENGLVVCPNCS